MPLGTPTGFFCQMVSTPCLFAVLDKLQLMFLDITTDHYSPFPIPHSPFLLLHFSNILFHAKFQGQTRKASLWENRMFYAMRSAQITQDF